MYVYCIYEETEAIFQCKSIILQNLETFSENHQKSYKNKFGWYFIHICPNIINSYFKVITTDEAKTAFLLFQILDTQCECPINI